MIYLDYAANTPVDKDVLDYFYDVSLKYYANPNSVHKLGLESKKIIDDATESIANNLGVLPEEIIYTSGSTESNNMVIKGVCERYRTKGKHIILSSLEHNSSVAAATAMQEKGFDVDLVSVNEDGLIDINKLKSLIREDTILVSIVAVDSELGLVQPIEEIGKLLKDYPNTFFHTDATQAVGKVTIDFSNVDLISFTPHKFYGLPGIGVLVKKKNVSLIPIINGGKSTTIYRSGTPTTALIASTAKALQIALDNLDDRYNHVKELNEKIINHLKKYDFIHINNTDKSVPYTINFSIKGVNSKDFAKMLEEKEIYVSTKTTCCADNSPSKIVYALTNDEDLAKSSLRVSISHLTTEDEVSTFLNTFDELIRRVN